MADQADLNSSKPNSFQQALSQPVSYGTPGAVAAFQIGWDVEHLRQWDPSRQQPAAAEQGTEPGKDWAARKILRIESALGDLRGTLIPKCLSIDTAGLLAAVQNRPYAETLTASGGQLPYKWTITGKLPEGLNLNASTGLVEGTPTELTTSALQVQVQDGTGVTASAWLTVVVTEKGDPFGPATYPSTTPLRMRLASIPDMTPSGREAGLRLEDAASELRDAVNAFGAQMWRALTVARASASLIGGGGGTQQSGTAMASTVGEAYELGIRLADVALLGESAATKGDLRKAFSQADSDPAEQAHALASRLRGAFPAGAAYAVARHLEDWSAWANDPAVSQTAGSLARRRWPSGSRWPSGPRWPSAPRWRPARRAHSAAVRHEDWRRALDRQGKIWESLLTGQSLGKDYLVAASYADAADHLIVTWSASTVSVARSLWRTPLGKIVFTLLVSAVVVVVGALVYNYGLTSGVRKTDSTGPGIATLVTVLVGALGGAAGLLHYVRAHVAGLTQKVWGLAEAPLANAEMLEAVAMATRRLPGDEGTGGASGHRQAAVQGRKHAKAGSALAPNVAAASR